MHPALEANGAVAALVVLVHGDGHAHGGADEGRRSAESHQQLHAGAASQPLGGPPGLVELSAPPPGGPPVAVLALELPRGYVLRPRLALRFRRIRAYWIPFKSTYANLLGTYVLKGPPLINRTTVV